MLGDNITNYSAKDTRRVDMVFGVSYADDIEKVKGIIKSVIEADSTHTDRSTRDGPRC